VYVLVSSHLHSGGDIYCIFPNRLGATEATKIAIPATARSSVSAGTTERKTDFQAPIWSAKFIGQITSACAINGQFVIPPDISIPIDIWNKLKNIVPRKNVSSVKDTILVIQFIGLIIAKSTHNGRARISALYIDSAYVISHCVISQQPCSAMLRAGY